MRSGLIRIFALLAMTFSYASGEVVNTRTTFDGTSFPLSTNANAEGYQAYIEGSSNSFTWAANQGTGTPASGGLKSTVTGTQTSRRSSAVRKLASSQASVVEVWETSLDVKVANLPGANDSNRSAELWLGVTSRTSSPSTSSDEAHKYLSDEDGGIMVKLTASHTMSTNVTTYGAQIRSNTSNVGTQTNIANTYLGQWVRVTLKVSRGSGSSYTVDYRLDDIGADGTGEPVLITQSVSNAVTNSNLSGGSTVYAAFCMATRTNTNVTSKTELYADNHHVSVTTSTPRAPVAQAASALTTTRLTANWTAPTGGLSPTGYILEMVKAGDAFEAGNFIGVNGETEQAQGISLTSSASSQRFNNLLRNQAYEYRLRASNAVGAGPDSEVTQVTTANVNTLPTIDAIAVPPPIYPDDSVDNSLTLTGLSTGGDDDQTLQISAVSSDPSIVPHPQVTLGTAPNPAGNATTGTLTYSSTGAVGQATVTVTITDKTGDVVEGSASQSFVVKVQNPLATHNFDLAIEMDQFGQASSSNITSGWNASAGIGVTPGGGISVVKTGSSHGYYNGWRTQPYDLTGKSLIQTSIMVNMSAFTSSSSTSGVYLGFVTNSGDVNNAPSGATSSFLTASNSSYRAISTYLSFTSSSSGTLGVQIHNKSGTSGAQTQGSMATQTGANATKANWLRVTLKLTPAGALGEYNAVTTVENMGLDGTSVISTPLTSSFVVSNSDIYNATKAYAAYNVYYRDSSSAVGTLKLDNHEAIVMTSPPNQPVANAATAISSLSFAANWTPAATGPGATSGYILEVIPANGNFETGPFIQANGETAASGIVVSSPSARSQSIQGLTPGSSYRYRVRSVNSTGPSPYSEPVDSFAISSSNLPPTLDAIATQPSISPGDTLLRTINLSGITHGGDLGQTISVNASVSPPGIITISPVIYSSPQNTGSFTYQTSGNSGTAVITVTVNDGLESVSRQVAVQVRPVPESYAFDDAEHMGEFGSGVPTNFALAWGAENGTGNPPGGGVTLTRTTTGSVGTYNGWRHQSFDLQGKTYIHTSIDINTSAWNNSGDAYLGFVTNTDTGRADNSPTAGYTTNYFTSSSASTYRAIGVYLDYSNSSNRFRLQLHNKTGSSSSTTVGSNGDVLPVFDTHKKNWLRLTLTLIPNGEANTYAAVTTLEDIGVDGTATPTVIATTSSNIANATIFAANRAYAAYTIVPGSSNTGITRLDNHIALAVRRVPFAPVIHEDPVLLVKHAFTSSWNRPERSAVDGYVLEVGKASDFDAENNVFLPNTLLSDDGANSENGIELGKEINSLRITGLTPSQTYIYRVKAFNAEGHGPYSENVTVTMPAATFNLPPTLSEIPTYPVVVVPDSGVYSVNLSGITDGGEGDQTVTFNATSSDQEIMADSSLQVINYDAATGTAVLQFEPDSKDGVVTITVTANDGQSFNPTFSRTFTVTVRTPPQLLTFDGSNSDWNNEYSRNGEKYSAAWNTTVGHNGTGGLTVADSGDDTSYASIWRNQPYNLVGKSYLYNSILIRPVGWTQGSGEERIYLGFSTNTNGAIYAPRILSSSTSSYRTIGVYLESRVSTAFRLDLFNKSNTSSTSATGSYETISNASTLRNNWLRLSVALIPSGAPGVYSVTGRLEDLGSDGLSEPVIVGTKVGTLTNADIAAASEAYAAYEQVTEEKDSGSVYVDNHEVIVSGSVPNAPLALPASLVVGQAFMANWQAPETSSVDGYVLEVSSDEGFNSDVQSINLGRTITSHKVTNLSYGTDYWYRVKAYNNIGAGAYSLSIPASTYAEGGNLAPTLNPVSFPLARISPVTGSGTVFLAGITDGGEGNQTLLINVSSSDPSIANLAADGLTYTSPNTSGQVKIAAGANSGIAIITITVSDGHAVNGSVSRQFPVNVGPAPVVAGLNTPEDYNAEFSTANSHTGRGAVWGDTSGQNGTGGLSIYYNKDDKNSRYASGWRKEPYVIHEANRMETSILIKPSGWSNGEGEKEHRATFHLGFAHNDPGVSNTSSLLVSGTAASLGATLSYDKEVNPYLYLALSNKSEGNTASSTLGRIGIPNGNTRTGNWLRLKVEYIPLTETSFDVKATVEDLGSSGTSQPELVGTVRQTLTNVKLASSTNAFAAYTHYMNSSADKSTGYTYLDDHKAVVEHGPPPAPILLDPTMIHSGGFTLNWGMPVDSVARGFLLQISNSSAFTTLFDENGGIGNAEFEGILIEDGQQFSQRIAGGELDTNTVYYYRVLGFNGDHVGDFSTIGTVTTLGAGVNASPTLAAISGPVEVYEKSGEYVVSLSGITDGGEGNESLEVTATSSNPEVIADPEIEYTSPASTANLNFSSGLGVSGTTTITVTVTDGRGGVATRDFDIHVMPRTPVLAFENTVDFTREIYRSSNAASLTHSPTQGVAGGGGLIMAANNRDSDLSVNGWRTERYDIASANYLRTSIMFNFAQMSDGEGAVAVGFVQSSTLPVNSSSDNQKDWLKKKGAGQYVSAYLKYKGGDEKYELILGNKPTPSEGSETKVEVENIRFNNWMRLSLVMIPTGTANTFTTTVRLEDMGANGTSTPTVVRTVTPSNLTLTNAALAQSSDAYAGFNIFAKETPNAFYIDNHEAFVTNEAPNAPVALAAGPVGSQAFQANWTSVMGALIHGYRIELSTQADDFAEGKLISASGELNQLEGFDVASTSTNTLITGLQPGTSYVYRIRSFNNLVGAGNPSNVINVTTAAEGSNLQPYFNSIPVQRAMKPGGGPATITITGISPGFGEEGQPLNLTATSSNAYASIDSVVYDGVSNTAQITYRAGSEEGVATITVTADDGHSTNGTFSREFQVNVRHPLVKLAFDSESDLAAHTTLSGATSKISYGASAGAGSPATGGLIMSNDGSEETVNGWRNEVYDMNGVTYLRTSVMAKLSEITREEVKLGVGFVHSSGVPAGTDKDWLKKKGPGQYISAHLKYKSDEFEVLIGNRTSNGDGSELNKISYDINGFNNWVRLSLMLIPIGGNDFNATLLLEDMGANGTSTNPSAIVTRGPYRVTNAALAASNEVYAGFNLFNKKTSQRLYIDNHEAIVSSDPPPAPLASAATNTTAVSFVANWQPGPETLVATGWLLEVSKAQDNFASGKLIGLDGVSDQAQGISIADYATRSLLVTNLNPASEYIYRVRAVNRTHISDASNEISLTTQSSGFNAAPTLAQITGPLRGTMTQVLSIPLGGISDGGEGNQPLNFSMTSSTPNLFESHVFNHTGRAAIGTLQITPINGVTGNTTLTITLSDGVDTVSRTVDVTIFARTTYIASGNGTTGTGAQGGLWKFLDTGAAPGVGWQAASFNDASWLYGRAALGYGMSVATAVSYGGNASSKYPAAFFRHRFEVENPNGIQTMTFRMKVDDGAVVYLNGSEIHRTANMPAGTITHTTWASSLGDDAVSWKTFTVPSSLLVTGENLLAVSVHQFNATSTDLYLDIELVAEEMLGALEDVLVTSLPASHVTSSSFRANWSVPVGEHVRGFELQVSTTPTFNAGTLLAANGIMDNSGIKFQDPTAVQTSIPGRYAWQFAPNLLNSATNYYYRVKTLNVDDATFSETQTVRTLNMGEVAAPNLDPIADITILPGDSRDMLLQLTGIISDIFSYHYVVSITPSIQSNSGLIQLLQIQNWVPNEDYGSPETATLRLRVVDGVYGESVIRVTVMDNSGKTFYQTFRVMVVEPTLPPGPSFASWASETFPGETNPNIIGPLADADFDGVPNLLEYAFGLDPSKSDGALALGELNTNGTHMTLTYRRRIGATDVQYSPQVSTTLKSWQANSQSVQVTEEVSATPIPGEPEMESVVVRSLIPIADTPRQFIRIKVATMD